jgi:DNA polymerase/3'-5' exonuclease PolX
MPVHNAEIATAFDHLADLLEIEGANPFRVRAYRNAARTIGDSWPLSDPTLRHEPTHELVGVDIGRVGLHLSHPSDLVRGAIA